MRSDIKVNIKSRYAWGVWGRLCAARFERQRDVDRISGPCKNRLDNCADDWPFRARRAAICATNNRRFDGRCPIWRGHPRLDRISRMEGLENSVYWHPRRAAHWMRCAASAEYCGRCRDRIRTSGRGPAIHAANGRGVGTPRNRIATKHERQYRPL